MCNPSGPKSQGWELDCSWKPFKCLVGTAGLGEGLKLREGTSMCWCGNEC